MKEQEGDAGLPTCHSMATLASDWGHASPISHLTHSHAPALPPGHTPCHAPSASLPLAEQASKERARAGQAHASMECMESEMGPF